MTKTSDKDPSSISLKLEVFKLFLFYFALALLLVVTVISYCLIQKKCHRSKHLKLNKSAFKQKKDIKQLSSVLIHASTANLHHTIPLFKLFFSIN